MKEVLKCYTINKIEDISIIVGPEEDSLIRKLNHIENGEDMIQQD